MEFKLGFEGVKEILMVHWWLDHALRVLLVVGYLQCAAVLLDECSAAPSGIRFSW